jgi:Cu+-exporting ATPase
MKCILKIKGMHCASCEVLIERKLRQLPGIRDVKINHATGEARIRCTSEPNIKQLNNAINGYGYSITAEETLPKNTGRDYAEIG